MTNQEIFDLMSRFERSSLCSMKLKTGDFSLVLSKGTPFAPAAASTPLAPAPTAVAAPGAEETPSILAPLVGTYYESSVPDVRPFVAVGDKVKKGQTVCLIEAMKMISEIPAPCDCIITEILKENGSLAAYHEPIFHYQPC